MTITTRNDGATAHLAVAGAMTIYEAPAAKQDLLAALRASDHLAVDLSGVEEIDTAGLQLLILLQREATRDAKHLQVRGRSAAVDEVFDRYGLRDAFDAPAVITRDVAALAEAIASERNSHEP